MMTQIEKKHEKTIEKRKKDDWFGGGKEMDDSVCDKSV